MERYYAHALQHWKLNEKHFLKVITLYSDLSYRTPGGLTREQAEKDPRSARPATNSLPGAEEQKAGIYNRSVFGGLSYSFLPVKRVRFVFLSSGMITDFNNPFITNYEFREEKNINVRTFAELKSESVKSFSWKWTTGAEWGNNHSDIRNYRNQSGLPDSLLSSDKLIVNQLFFFSQFSADLGEKWIAEVAASVNSFQTIVTNGDSYPLIFYDRHTLATQLLPRFSFLYKIIPGNLAWRASLSMGYSPPTLAEIRPSTMIPSNDLQAENGLNYETGIRFRDDEEKLFLDASVFYFQLQSVIVRRTDSTGAEYFINAGNVEQPGFEIQWVSRLIRSRETGFIRGLTFSSCISHSNFYFSNYIVNATDHSGKQLTGVPRIVVSSVVHSRFLYGMYLTIQHNFTDIIPLNDANSFYADAYNLLQCTAGWVLVGNKKRSLEVYAGADNLLDASYSLGNDLNAFGGRYFNPAPGRNYFAGIRVSF